MKKATSKLLYSLGPSMNFYEDPVKIIIKIKINISKRVIQFFVVF